MKTLLLIIAITTLGFSSFAQERSKLSDSALNKSLKECLYKYDSEYQVTYSKHMDELSIPKCGGTIKVVKNRNRNDKIVPRIVLSNTKKCSYVTIGTNKNFQTKSVTSHHALEGYRTNFDGKIKVKKSQVNFNYSSSDNNVRMVVHSKSGKTCARIKVYLKKVY